MQPSIQQAMRESGGGRVPFWRTCGKRILAHNITAMSAALSFRTIFALVPLLVLAFLLLKSVGVLENSKESLRRVLEASGFSQILLSSEEGSDSPGAAGAQGRAFNVADEIEKLVERVEGQFTIGRVGPVGILLLFYTATTLLTALERSLDRIFGASRSRSLVRRLPTYWVMMTLGPLLLTAGLYIGRQGTQTLDHVASWLRVLAVLAESAAPLVGCVLVFWAVYKLLPNAEVPWRAALLGAAIAGPVWLAARWGFAIYVARFVKTGNLYGVVGLIPLFLVWLNLSWLILLLGAELAHAFGERTPGLKVQARSAHSPADQLAIGLAVYRRYLEGGGPSTAETVSEELGVPASAVQELLADLCRLGLLLPVAGEGPPGYAPLRPAQKTSVSDLLGMAAWPTPAAAAARNAAVSLAVQQLQLHVRDSLSSVTVADLLNGSLPVGAYIQDQAAAVTLSGQP